jgi:hypothetical protein
VRRIDGGWKSYTESILVVWNLQTIQRLLHLLSHFDDLISAAAINYADSGSNGPLSFFSLIIAPICAGIVSSWGLFLDPFNRSI